MCGIAGFTQFTSPVGDKTTLLAMGDAIAHRGPDAHGEYMGDDVGLCHRRLSIIDLSTSGNQPMYTDDRNYVLVFNGEIYNFQELRKELTQQGYQFRTKTDTEVILALYQSCGTETPLKLNGMFAFALWDAKKKSLFLARDRLGKKPLYYYREGNKFIFGSEIKAILQAPGVKKDIRHDAIYDFFNYQYVPDPKTIFNYIHKLKPGHWMQVTGDRVKIEQYWDVSFGSEISADEKAIASELRDVINESTKMRMVSDVPLGAFLSGGVDSSAVVALMAENSSTPVTTCSIGFDSEKFDEVKYAKAVAEQFKTDHHEFTVRETVEANIEKIVSYFDEPFADSSAIPTYFVSQLARQQVTVALAGDGGDESFAGYSKYNIDNVENRIRQMFPGFLRRGIFPLLGKMLKNGNHTLFRKGFTLLNTLSIEPGYGFYLTNSFFDEGLWRELINDDFKRELGDYHPSSITTDYYEQADTDNHLSKILYTDIKTYLPGDILVKVDRMSMAHSLEVRAPLLDYRVVEYAASIPSQLKLNNGEKKYILKKSFENTLTDNILYRKKMGFTVPLAEWLRNELKPIAEEKLFAANSGLSRFFRIEGLQKVWDQHQNSERDYSATLWSFLMFEMWWQNYIEGPSH